MSRLLKVLFATAAGFVAGVLVAPKSGKETRADLKRKADEAKGEVAVRAEQAKAAAEAAAGSVKHSAKKAGVEAEGFAKSAKQSATVMRDEAERLSEEAKVRAARVGTEAKKTLGDLRKDDEKTTKK